MRGKEVLRAVLIGIAVTLLLGGIIAIIVYFSLSAANKTMTFLATDAAPISLSKLSVTDFVALISGTSSF
jgi:ABC-type Fe3+-siderophore transport system permease subunit